MVILAHIREQHRLNLQSYGRPRMTEELQELGVKVGHRRVGRLMGENGIKIISIVETFFKSIKAELIWRNRWATRRQAEGAIFQSINGFYNPRRHYSSLGGKSPSAFERKAV